MLEHVLAHLASEDVRALRLTAQAFSGHPAILQRFTSASLDMGAYSLQPQPAAWQAGLAFLCRLPRLKQLELRCVETLHGFHQLTQLSSLTILLCPTVLDLFPLQQLPLLRCLTLFNCPALMLGNLSVLCGLTELAVKSATLHSDVAHLTNLKVLKLREMGEYDGNMDSSSFYSGLTGVTFLCDSPDGDPGWHALPLLQALEVTPCIQSSLQSIAAVTALRALSLDMGELDSGLTSLAPLTSLVQLQRLFLVGRTLPLPALAALTRLTVDFYEAGEELTGMAGLPQLRELHVEHWHAMKLPDLAGPCPHLTRIVFINDYGGRLSIDIQELLSRRLVVERHNCLLAIDEDEY